MIMGRMACVGTAMSGRRDYNMNTAREETLRTSIQVEPLPTLVSSAFLSLNVVPDVAISPWTSETPMKLLLYSHVVLKHRIR